MRRTERPFGPSAAGVAELRRTSAVDREEQHVGAAADRAVAAISTTRAAPWAPGHRPGPASPDASRGQLKVLRLIPRVAGYADGMEDIRLPLTHDTPASAARRACERALDGWELSERADDVLLVTTELVQNVAQHTDDGGELHLALHDDTILVEVTDTNPQPPRLQHLDLCKPGGRGLLLIAATARRWGTRPASWAGRTGKVVWAELTRRLSS